MKELKAKILSLKEILKDVLLSRKGDMKKEMTLKKMIN